jgi:hypothetical protein
LLDKTIFLLEDELYHYPGISMRHVLLAFVP